MTAKERPSGRFFLIYSLLDNQYTCIMNNKYFKDCNNPSDLSTRYNEIVRVFKLDEMPDCPFKNEVESEFRSKMDYFTSEPKKSVQQDDGVSEEIVQAWLKAKGIPAEKIGKWYWIPKSAEDDHKYDMKHLGFRFSQSKQRYYWRAEEYRSSNPNPLPIEEIRRKYGSRTLEFKY